MMDYCLAKRDWFCIVTDNFRGSFGKKPVAAAGHGLGGLAVLAGLNTLARLLSDQTRRQVPQAFL
jgi:hypothetical protein